MKTRRSIPVIDLFAGPGGLSEGFAQFSRFRNERLSFDVKLSIEKDAVAAQTLRLRSFFRSFDPGEVPECYYEFLRGDDAALAKIQAMPEWAEAAGHVWNGTLGDIDEKELHSRIRSALAGTRDWVLLGGPPCQAYSIIGRARMSGLGHTVRSEGHDEEDLKNLKEAKEAEFLEDHRHTLYREYLRIVAVHKPAIFVMENVKGILSSRLSDGESENGKPKFKKAFGQIRRDLENPWLALEDDKQYDLLHSLLDGEPSKYRLYSFVKSSDGDLLHDYKDQDFLIRAEEHGVPQKRHRVILLGIRDDIPQLPEQLSIGGDITVRHVIESMPKLRSGLSKEKDEPGAWLEVMREAVPESVLGGGLNASCKDVMHSVLSRNEIDLDRGHSYIHGAVTVSKEVPDLKRWLEDDKLGGVIQHETRAHMNSDLGRYLFVSAMGAATSVSPKLDEWPPELLPDHQNVKNEIKDFRDRFKVQTYDHPASTITAHISKDGHYFIHPDPYQCRSLTVREAARLQTFPDSYFFCGSRTQQYHQVGNAVPPYLAVQLAEIVADLF